MDSKRPYVFTPITPPSDLLAVTSQTDVIYTDAKTPHPSQKNGKDTEEKSSTGVLTTESGDPKRERHQNRQSNAIYQGKQPRSRTSSDKMITDLGGSMLMS